MFCEVQYRISENNYGYVIEESWDEGKNFNIYGDLYSSYEEAAEDITNKIRGFEGSQWFAARRAPDDI